MADPRVPESGEIQLVLLLDEVTFIAWAPAATLNDLMDAFERRAKLTEEDRQDKIRQMSIRLGIVERLRWPAAGAAFTDVLASGCLWLSFRHYELASKLRAGMEEQMAETGSAVLTVSIGETPGAQPGTAWGFTIGDRIHDYRPQLAVQPAATLRLIERT